MFSCDSFSSEYINVLSRISLRIMQKLRYEKSYDISNDINLWSEGGESERDAVEKGNQTPSRSQHMMLDFHLITKTHCTAI